MFYPQIRSCQPRNGHRYIVSCFVFICCIVSGAKNLSAFPRPDSVNNSPIIARKDSIISVENLGVHKDSTKIKEVIVITMSPQTAIDSINMLYVDGIAINGLQPWKVNYAEKKIYFKLDERVQNILLKFLESSPFEKSVMKVYFGAGSAKRYADNTHYPLYIEVRQRINHIWIWAAAIALLLMTIVSLRSNILKDDNNLYYSLGRTQLFYWTLLVLIAYLFISFETDTLTDLPLSVLAILGISVSTTAISKMVENKNKGEVPIDTKAKSEGFFFDILSDGSSINIQRFQNVAFNLFFGVIFLQKAFGNHIMPDFDQNVLLLMGISSGAYAGLKNTEATKDQNEPAKQTGDDIPAEKDTPADEKTEKESPA